MRHHSIIARVIGSLIDDGHIDRACISLGVDVLIAGSAKDKRRLMCRQVRFRNPLTISWMYSSQRVEEKSLW